jgi:sugar phosphate isomerase/epimerase
MTYSRRDFGKMALAALPAAAAAAALNSKIAGVQIGAMSYSFRDLPVTEIIPAMLKIDLSEIESISSSSRLSLARRVAPFAEKYALPWGAHGHDNVQDAEEFATPEVFAKVMALNKYMWVNLDIGHFTAAGYDAVAYIKEHHARITNLHLKDCKKNVPGDPSSIAQNNWPWGEGDTPIKPVLQLLKKEKYDIPANIEYEYASHATGDTITEVTRCFDYARKALEGGPA